MPSLLFPTGPAPRPIETGSFSCPACATTRPFTRVEVGRILRLFAIKVPAGVYGEYVECAECLSTYRPDVLAYDAPASRSDSADDAEQAPDILSEYQRALRRVLALLVITDGRMEQSELHTVQRVYEAVTGQRLTREAVIAEVEDVAEDPTTAARFLSSVVGYLNDRGKQQILRGAAMVSSADGHIHESEEAMVRRLAAVMKLDDELVETVLKDFG